MHSGTPLCTLLAEVSLSLTSLWEAQRPTESLGVLCSWIGWDDWFLEDFSNIEAALTEFFTVDNSIT